VYDGLEIDCQGLRSTTWKRPEVDRGVESDLCYYFDAVKLEVCEAAVARNSNDGADYPIPDLVIEIGFSPSKIDRPGIYSTLRIPEVWRFKNDIVSIEQVAAPDAIMLGSGPSDVASTDDVEARKARDRHEGMVPSAFSIARRKRRTLLLRSP
jgi:hypothetical protein